MNRQIWSIVVSLLLAFPLWARISDGQVQIDKKDNDLFATVSPGFHFNAEAPAKLTAGEIERQPLRKLEKQIVFDSKGLATPFKISFYVCDDKKTACEEHVYHYRIQAGRLIATNPERAQATTSAWLPVADGDFGLAYDDHGFIQNDLKGALALAKKENKLLFVDIGAPWCPACVRLETEVFGTPIFKNAMKSLIKVTLNSDSPVNAVISDTYKIKVLPTLLVLNPDGEEVFRSVDYKPADILVREFAPHLNTKADKALSLVKKAETGDKKAISELALRAFGAYQYEEALKWYEKLGDKNAHYAQTEMTVAAGKDLKDEKNQKAYSDTLRKWIAWSPRSYTAIMARNEWATSFGDKELPAEVKAELQTNADLLQKLANSPVDTKRLFATWKVSTVQPFEREEILSQWIKTKKHLKQESVAQQKLLAQSLSQRKLSLKRPGEILWVLPYFRDAQMAKEEGEWLTKLAAQEPNSYVYQMKLAGYYKRQKDYTKALPVAQKAVELGPDLRLYNMQTVAELQKQLKLNADAKRTIEQALALPEAKAERFKSVATELETMRKSL